MLLELSLKFSLKIIKLILERLRRDLQLSLRHQRMSSLHKENRQEKLLQKMLLNKKVNKHQKLPRRLKQHKSLRLVYLKGKVLLQKQLLLLQKHQLLVHQLERLLLHHHQKHQLPQPERLPLHHLHQKHQLERLHLHHHQRRNDEYL